MERVGEGEPSIWANLSTVPAWESQAAGEWDLNPLAFRNWLRKDGYTERY
jgi:hypothetical protein